MNAYDYSIASSAVEGTQMDLEPAVVQADSESEGAPKLVPRMAAALVPSSSEHQSADETNHVAVLSRLDQILTSILADLEALCPVVVLTGDGGTGKTMLVRRAMRMLDRRFVPVLLSEPAIQFVDFLDIACRQFDLGPQRSTVEIDPERRFQIFWDSLLAQHARGRSLLVLADNAHKLSEALLSELASLSKYVNHGKHVLQLVLVGLPRLHAIVGKLLHRELIDEGYPIYRLAPLEANEVQAFVSAQYSGLEVHAGPGFVPEAVKKVAAYSEGIPRSILTLCKLAILKANLEGRSAITPDLIDQVAHSGMCDQDLHAPDPLEGSGPSEGAAQAPPLPTSRENTEESHPTKLNRLHEILRNLQGESPSIEASAVISQDGLMIASALSPDLDDARVGTVTATLLSLSTCAAAELRRGEVKEVIIRGDAGYAFIVSASRGMLLLTRLRLRPTRCMVTH